MRLQMLRRGRWRSWQQQQDQTEFELGQLAGQLELQLELQLKLAGELAGQLAGQLSLLLQ